MPSHDNVPVKYIFFKCRYEFGCCQRKYFLFIERISLALHNT